jgi:hypothetical protein
MRTFLALTAILSLVSCVTQRPAATSSSVATSDRGLITYYDRNNDGRVDYELHDFGCCDRNWALVDTDFSGRYDLELRWGYAFVERPADAPVATGFSISAGDPLSFSAYPFGPDVNFQKHGP